MVILKIFPFQNQDFSRLETQKKQFHWS